MFVVPCKYIEGRSLIQECIQSIKKHHPEELIVVVDSNSDDKSYFAYIEDIPNVVICDKANVHYIIGALWQAYEMFPDEHHYVLIHDTIIIKKPLTQFLHDEETYSFLYFDDHVVPPHHQAMMDKFILPNYSSNVSIPILGVFGTAAIFKNPIIKSFVSKNLHNTLLPINKEECQMSERVLGVVLAAEGVDVVANCIEQKNCLTYWSSMYTDGFEYIRKTITIRE